MLDLNFDEMDGPALDGAAPGAVKDKAEPANGVVRTSSPFWNVRSGQAAKFDPGKTQFFQIADSPDLNQAAGCSLSFYALNLLDPADKAFHGIVAKRSTAPQKANYGFNFQPASKKLQVYVNDGTTYKVVGFPVDASLGYRRLVHLTATFRPGDAPDADADSDVDDLEIALYVNGKPLKPLDSTGGPLLDDAGWVTDVNYSGMLSDAPMTIGASYPNGEPFGGLIDELLLFNRPLSREEAARLFHEVAGEKGDELARLEAESPATSGPVISSLVPRGTQIGTTTRVTITGQNLGPSPTLTLLGLPLDGASIVESASDRIVADITIPANHPPALLPLAVRTGEGVSAPVPFAADRLPQRLISEVPKDQPAEQPVAYTGTLNGTDRHRLLIDGRKGETFVAEVELKRLGGMADPVLELKAANDAPIEVAWGHAQRGGDARLVATLPADGRYTVELHDLAYKAPASQFRLLIGELSLIDAVLPPAVEATSSTQAQAIGVGLADSSLQVSLPAGEITPVLAGPAVALSQGVLPAMRLSDGRELTEAEAAKGTTELASSVTGPTYITGQFSAAGETDRFVFRTSGDQPVTVEAIADSLGSAVEPDVVVVQNGKRLGRKNARPGEGSAKLSVTPVEGELTVEISDRLRGYGPERIYRLRVARASTPELSATILNESVLLPQTGRGIARLRIERNAAVGDVRLVADSLSGVVVEPAVIPKGPAAQDVFITIRARGDQPPGPVLRLSVEADTAVGTLQRRVEATVGPLLAGFDAGRPYYDVPIVASASAPAIEIVRLPAAALKGVTDSIGVRISGDVPAEHVVRVALVTDEPPRPIDPKNAAAGMKPAVRLAEDAVIPPGGSDAIIPLEVPADVQVAEIDAVIRAEVVPHFWSKHVEAVGYSAPIRLPVAEAVTTAGSPSAPVIKNGDNDVRVVISRAEGFTQPVRVELRGLREGIVAVPADIPANASEATVKATVAPGTAAGPVSDAELVVLSTNGVVLKSVKPFAIAVGP